MVPQKISQNFLAFVLGLPKLLFNEGFNKFSSFCTRVGFPILTYPFLGSASKTPGEEDNSSPGEQLYVNNEMIKFKGGNGAFEHATYLELIKASNMIKHEIL